MFDCNITQTFLLAITFDMAPLFFNVLVSKQKTTTKPLYEYKKKFAKEAELPKPHPVLSLDKYADNFRSLVHYHELMRTKTQRKLYVQYLGPKRETLQAGGLWHAPSHRYRRGSSDSHVAPPVHTRSHELSNFTEFKSQLETPLRAVVILLHGYADHSSRNLLYIDTKNLCVENRFVVVGMDCHGHGFSCGTPGYVHCIKKFAQDIVELTEQVKREFPSLPVILLGGSMGGLVSLTASYLNPDLYAGLILVSPLIVQRIYNHRILHGPARVAAHAGFGRMGLLPPLSGFFTLQEEEEHFYSDPLVWKGRMCIGTGYAFVKGMKKLRNKEKLKPLKNLPILVQFGDKDTLVDHERSINTLTNVIGGTNISVKTVLRTA